MCACNIRMREFLRGFFVYFFVYFPVEDWECVWFWQFIHGIVLKNSNCVLTDVPEVIWNWLEYRTKVAKYMLTCTRGVEFAPLRN